MWQVKVWNEWGGIKSGTILFQNFFHSSFLNLELIKEYSFYIIGEVLLPLQTEMTPAQTSKGLPHICFTGFF